MRANHYWLPIKACPTGHLLNRGSRRYGHGGSWILLSKRCQIQYDNSRSPFSSSFFVAVTMRWQKRPAERWSQVSLVCRPVVLLGTNAQRPCCTIKPLGQKDSTSLVHPPLGYLWGYAQPDLETQYRLNHPELFQMILLRQSQALSVWPPRS